MPLCLQDKDNRVKSATINGFLCNYPNCSQKFNRQWKLERHQNSHTGERPYKCQWNECTKAYQCKTHLLRHVRTKHEKPKVILPCTMPDCKATFTVLSALKKHIEYHGRPRPFACSVCSASFQKYSKLWKHSKTHALGKKLHECGVCGSKWAVHSLLRRHLLSHNVRQCEQADCTFTCQSRLQMRKHEKIFHPLVYICDACKKSFNNKGILREHVLTHLSECCRGVFPCPMPLCRRAYFQKRNLVHHIKVFHSSPRYYCSTDGCQSSFISEVQLMKHCRSKHKQPSDDVKNRLLQDLTRIPPIFHDSSLSLSRDSVCPDLADFPKEKPCNLLISIKNQL